MLCQCHSLLRQLPMSILSITEAAHVVGVSRRTIQRSIQTGRLSAATTATGERAIDTAELLRVFGPLRQAPSDIPTPMSQPVATDDATKTLIELLQEQLQKAEEREQQAQQEKAQLLTLLQAEQSARRELEQRLLPAPKSRPTPIHPAQPVRLWLVIALAVAALAFVGWQWRDLIILALNG